MRVKRAALASLALASGCAALQPPPAAATYSPVAAPYVSQMPTDMPLQDMPGEPIDLSELYTQRYTAPAQGDSEADYRLENAAEGRRQLMETMAGGMPGVVRECPLVFVPPQSTVTFESSPDAAFDWSGEQPCAATDWPTAHTPWLAIDRNDDGVIDSGAELFGTGVVLADGVRAQHGFEALAELDDDHDGAITPADAAWSSVVLWADHDRNRISSPDELSSLDDHGLTSLSLDYARPFECDAAGNCAGERASAMGTQGTAGQLVDVYLRCR